MEQTKTLTDEQREALAFVGSALSPLFLQDPRKGDAGELFASMAALDAEEAAEAWPFVAPAEAVGALRLMVDGLADGIDADDLTWEYRRLFIGPGRKAAPPWGSVYTDRDCVVFGLTTLDLRAWMRANGIERTADDKMPEDHIGLLVALMGWLAQEKPELVPELLEKHLLTWSSHYLEQLEAAAEHPFYEGLARLTRLTLEGIQDDLGLEVVYPRYYR
ncbi:Tat proofreading chaperone DmsD [Eggerthellaceae bacterium zg-887]|uniref:Tat proofreading chaperone DmsD n=1 Tax=Xiamenia xianingshaonis TaxID=2682776 RepID=UPI00140A21FD|nr:Tat proofreading chaperone DmsD [Xiamenia xianingshaonis]NHM15069.1 Tat proofreading chaperone DmsD [Xiamenia xianingshaonis]